MRFSDFTGRALRATVSTTDLKISYFAARTWDLNVIGSGRSVLLPNATYIPTGGGHFDLFNVGTGSIDLKDNSGTVTVATIAAGDTAKVILINNSTPDGSWRATVVTTGSIPAPPETLFMTTLGGATATAREVWQYDHVLDSWAQGPNDSINQHIQGQGFRTTSAGYVVAGTGSSDAVESYDPTAWTTRSNFGHSQANCAGDSSGGNGYTIGNNIFAADRSDDTNRYDVAGDSWSLVQEYPAIIVNRQTVEADDDEDLWVMGGTTGTNNNWNGNQDNRVYAPGLDTYTSKTDILIEARGEHASFLLDSKIHILNGRTGGNLGVFSTRNDQWDPNLESWTNRLDWTLSARSDGGGATIGSSSFYVGGSTSSGEVDETLEYTLLNSYVTRAAHAANNSTRNWRDTTLDIPI